MPDYTHTLKAFTQSAEKAIQSEGLRNPSADKIHRRVANTLIVLHHWGALEQHYASSDDV